jgi:hypothetical protein
MVDILTAMVDWWYELIFNVADVRDRRCKQRDLSVHHTVRYSYTA